MPDRALGKIMTAMDPADVGQLAMVECLRQIADGNKKLGTVLEGMQTELRDVRERVIRIEASKFDAEVAEVRAEVTENRRRIEALEAKENVRAGVGLAADAVVKYGPLVVTIIGAVFVLLMVTGKVSL